MNTTPPHDLKDSAPNVCSETATNPTPMMESRSSGQCGVMKTPGTDLLRYAQEDLQQSRRMKEEVIRLDSIVMRNILQSLARIEAKLDAINATKQTP